ncbi:putative necrosis-inducing factor-domain-containing protein [Cercophora samala]|uniref:Necrosis-inducing factor-domain-containing protein n=1 Tax=Cercophora samala TaxID=330535 RepID=A0AA39YKA0_9PEZI|nr:putative necrosis-inducing factor-domain-containing protein [Cercophora samala]
MQLIKLTVAIAGLFTAAVQAAPAVHETGVTHSAADIKADGYNDTLPLPYPKLNKNCRDDFEYYNDTSQASPLIKDCWQIYNNIEKNDGSWTGTMGHRKILSYGTCAYDVWPDSNGLWWNIKNDDVRLTIKRAIEKFAVAWPGEDYKVGAHGKLACETYVIDWSIYHN